MIAHKCDGCRYKGEHVEMGFKPFGVCYKETNLIEAQKNYNAETCPYNKKMFITNSGYDINKKTPYADKIAEAEQTWIKEEKPAYLPQLYKIEGVDLAEVSEEWPKENPYIKNIEIEAACGKINVALADLKKLIGPAIEAVAEIVGRLVKMISDALPSLFDTLGDVMEQIINLYPNKRVIHLAKHGKRRTRKKNINRILKYYKRNGPKAPVFAQN